MIRSTSKDKAKYIGDRIRVRRQELGLYQSDIADSCGVSVSTVSQWESNKQKPKKLMELSVALKCSMAWLQTGEAPRTPGNPSRPGVTLVEVPLVDLKQIKPGFDFDVLQSIADGAEKAPAPGDVSVYAFAVEIQDDSMMKASSARAIPKGTVLIVDPDFHEIPGDFYVVTSIDNRACCRELKEQRGKPRLVPLNKSFDSFDRKDMDIIGKVRYANIPL